MGGFWGRFWAPFLGSIHGKYAIVVIILHVRKRDIPFRVSHMFRHRIKFVFDLKFVWNFHLNFTNFLCSRRRFPIGYGSWQTIWDWSSWWCLKFKFYDDFKKKSRSFDSAKGPPEMLLEFNAILWGQNFYVRFSDKLLLSTQNQFHNILSCNFQNYKLQFPALLIFGGADKKCKIARWCPNWAFAAHFTTQRPSKLDVISFANLQLWMLQNANKFQPKKICWLHFLIDCDYLWKINLWQLWIF